MLPFCENFINRSCGSAPPEVRTIPIPWLFRLKGWSVASCAPAKEGAPTSTLCINEIARLLTDCSKCRPEGLQFTHNPETDPNYRLWEPCVLLSVVVVIV